jgi:hypothetical protein
MSIKQYTAAAMKVLGVPTLAPEQKAAPLEVLAVGEQVALALAPLAREYQAQVRAIVAQAEAEVSGYWVKNSESILDAEADVYPVVGYGYYGIPYEKAITAISRFSPIDGDLFHQLKDGEDVIVSITESDWSEKPEGWSDVALIEPVAINLAGYSFQAQANPLAWKRAKAASLQVKALIQLLDLEPLTGYAPAVKSKKDSVSLQSLVDAIPVS